MLYLFVYFSVLQHLQSFGVIFWQPGWNTVVMELFDGWLSIELELSR